MKQASYVVVFPAIFSKNKIPQLIFNIKYILKAKSQPFNTVKRDGDVILVDANDPVFASSAIGLLFGISKIAIARLVENDFEKVVSEISLIGGNLLLKGERFLVKVEGTSKGFLTSDVELAATSNIIEKKSEMGAKPGTEHNYDKLLYTYLTKKNAYICIFLDRGAGGIPFQPTEPNVICGIYDELSAVSCYETIRQGYNPKVIACYRKKSELINLAKMINQILPRMLKERITIELFLLPTNMGKSSYTHITNLVLKILMSRAESCKIQHVAVPTSPLTFPMDLVAYLTSLVFKGGKIPILPLGGLDSQVFEDAKELRLERRIGKMKKLLLQNHKDISELEDKTLDSALKNRQDITIVVGPNNIHDFLDSLESNH